MKFSWLLTLVSVFCLSILLVATRDRMDQPESVEYQPAEYTGPEEFESFHSSIRTPDGADKPEYQPGFIVREYERARAAAVARQRAGSRIKSNGVVEWKERGPNNVPGRTRGLIVDPDDPQKNTWYAGSVSGGAWKTTDGGLHWTLITPELPNLATSVLAMAPSNPNIIYIGTGEGFGNIDRVRGHGMYKSVDRGNTWSYLPSTSAFSDVNRAVVHPSNPNLVVVATNNGIYRTTNGGTDWTQVSDRTMVQDLKATPGNFNVLYAAQRFVGVLKSTDGGVTWHLSSTGIAAFGRVEIDISPVNPNRLFAAAEGSSSQSQKDQLYVSDNGGNHWVPVNVMFNNETLNFLGGQGWYDNTVACDPFNPDIVYFGGVNLFRAQLTGTGTTTAYAVQDNTGFLTLVNFSASQYNGRLEVGPGDNKSVELRFGPGRAQLAHRFTVPSNGGTNQNGGPGVPDNQYSFQNYITVPFEAWEIDNNGDVVRQLMVSFRDQQRDGAFNLNVRDDANDPDLLTSREYVFIHNITYQPVPDAGVATTGGHTVNRMYFFWPTLTSGTWNPASLPDATFRILVSNPRSATTITVSDAYSQFDRKNAFINYGVDMHPDHHNLVMIPMSASTYKILNANDGGVFISNISPTPGILQGDWAMRGRTYRTSQFYGADKRPGYDEYIGGMQDNGTWKSPANQAASSATNYVFNFGGDGFEAIWHNLDELKIIGSSQGNNFRRSTNGGSSWQTATSGLSGTHPFLSKLANSRDNPDVIFTLSSDGVFRSTNFGESWTLTPIAEKWGGSSSFMDVEVSRANANIVWAGSGMSNTGTLRNLHVSTDAGVTFAASANYNLVTMGNITKLASHPSEPHTAYALFSFSGRPKILRTHDLGQSWEDISGFGTGSSSSTGFPDVAVYCLYVRPDNPDIIWAGTEIGIVESIDNGQTWNLISDFPSVSVWDMKGQDNQVVIATHGRGIWTATIEAPQLSVTVPEIVDSGTSPSKKLMLKIYVSEPFDKVELYDGNILLGELTEVAPSEIVLAVSNLAPGIRAIKMISYRGSAPYHSKTYAIDHLDILSVEDSYGTYFTSTNDLTFRGFALSNLSLSPTGSRPIAHSSHPYAINFNHMIIIRHPVRVSGDFPILQYQDVALVEPGIDGAPFGSPDFKDYVVMEATKNGLDWVPLAEGYDARFSEAWLTAYQTSAVGTVPMLVHHEIDLTETFNPGDSLLIRYRLFSNGSISGWGAAVNFILVQQGPTEVQEIVDATAGLTVYPNPASTETTLRYSLSRPTDVSIQLIDVTGRVWLNTSLVNQVAGEHRHVLNLDDLAQGNYIVQLITSTREQRSAKLVVRR